MLTMNKGTQEHCVTHTTSQAQQVTIVNSSDNNFLMIACLLKMVYKGLVSPHAINLIQGRMAEGEDATPVDDSVAFQQPE